MTFEDLAKVFEKKKLVKDKYVNGRKVSGPVADAGRDSPPRAMFGRRLGSG
jgi:hypothetical protein